MPYWVVRKNGKYLVDIDEQGHVIYSKDKSKAYRFDDLNDAMVYFELGFCVIKEYWEEAIYGMVWSLLWS